MTALEMQFYRQTLDFTCGSACILMTLSHFDRAFSADRDAEIDIWREATSVLALGMGRYGISFPFLKRGYGVEIVTNSEGIDFMPRLRQRVGEAHFPLFVELYDERKRRDFQMGLMERHAVEVTAADAIETLERGGVPIILTDASQLGDDVAPHWVVVTGLDGSTLSINNPLSETGNSIFPASDFGRIAGFQGEMTLVSVFRGSGSGRR